MCAVAIRTEDAHEHEHPDRVTINRVENATTTTTKKESFLCIFILSAFYLFSNKYEYVCRCENKEKFYLDEFFFFFVLFLCIIIIFR